VPTIGRALGRHLRLCPHTTQRSEEIADTDGKKGPPPCARPFPQRGSATVGLAVPMSRVHLPVIKSLRRPSKVRIARIAHT
jgi:hypothetical protein